ncbi:hypothetical protein GQ53DRAFT_740457 [Thozetella sp. PMI_491]|nr:hypothetical protein GQ53DRAFT_740457 [Thozetella sp. PMI_491]
MDNLSPETISLIVVHLFAKPPPPAFLSQRTPPLRRSPYAAISQRWQRAVEQHTFSTIRLQSKDLAAFQTLFSDLRRRALLRQLHFTVMLPTHGDSQHGHAENVAAFEAAISALFAMLAEWETQEGENDVANISNLELRLGAEWDIDKSEGPVDFDFDVTKSSASRRYLTAEGVELPAVRRISAFQTFALAGRTLHPTATCKILAALPHLEKLDLEFLDPVPKRRELRRSLRIALGTGLERLQLPKLMSLRLSREEMASVNNHSFDCGDLEQDGIDALNAAVRKLAQSSPLTHLDLSDCLVSTDLFQHRSSPGGSNSSIWSTLQEFHINGGIVSPSGAWYYTGDAGASQPEPASPIGDDDDDDDEEDDDSDGASESDDDLEADAVANGNRPTHIWRNRPDPDVFNRLAQAMADAVLHMPSLEMGQLQIGMNLHSPVGIELQCAAAGREMRAPDWTPEPDQERLVRRWRVWVGIESQWAVPAEVTAKWKEWVGEEGIISVGKWPN